MNAIPPRLTAVTLGARDLPGLRNFYDALGFRRTVTVDDEFAAFLVGGVVLALFPLELLAAEAAPGAEPPRGGWSGVTLAINVDERGHVDAAFAAAVEAGATAVAEPVDRDFGGRSGYVADPEGNRWEIVWAPGIECDPITGAVTKFGD
jgi:uncharacterized protein